MRNQLTKNIIFVAVGMWFEWLLTFYRVESSKIRQIFQILIAVTQEQFFLYFPECSGAWDFYFSRSAPAPAPGFFFNFRSRSQKSAPKPWNEAISSRTATWNLEHRTRKQNPAVQRHFLRLDNFWWRSNEKNSSIAPSLKFLMLSNVFEMDSTLSVNICSETGFNEARMFLCTLYFLSCTLIVKSEYLPFLYVLFLVLIGRLIENILSLKISDCRCDILK